ncbi:MAG: flagellar biosynthesis protein FlhB [Rhodothermales bacterium]
MSEKDERTEDPTARKLSQARGEGQVFRSQEVLSVGMLLIGVTVLGLGTPWAIQRLQDIMSSILLASNTTELNISSFQSLVMTLGTQVVLVLLPLMGTLMVAGIILNVAQFGWNFTFKPLMPKASKINPLAGFKRIFSVQGLFQFFKSLMKIVIVLPVAYIHIEGLIEEVVVLHTQQMESIFKIAGGWILGLFLKVILVLIVLTIIDFAYEKWKFKEDLKMSKQEVKDERKQADGDPKIKKERFKMALKLLRRPRLDHAVMKADVVVTNPTHFAVALKYDVAESPAPRVLVKGIRKRALRIRALALEKNIPVIEDPPLARALYRSVSEEQEIPEELYPAVATMLAAIYKKRKNRSFASA